MPKKDTFETWKDNGKWPEYREILRKGAINHYTEKEIASCLNISQDTFTRIKKKHPEILNEMDDARRKDREDLIDAMRKLALGQAKTISKRKVLKSKAGVVTEEKLVGETETILAPNANAIEYLLATGHDDRYSVPYRKLKLMESQVMKDLEEINNARSIGQDSDNEDK